MLDGHLLTLAEFTVRFLTRCYFFDTTSVNPSKQNNDVVIFFASSDIIHLLDSAEPDIRFVLQIEADVGRSEAESNISLDLHNKSNVRRGAVQQMFYYAEITK